MDKLKLLARQALQKILAATTQQHQEDQQNRVVSSEGQLLPFKDLLDLYSLALDDKEKALVEIALVRQLEKQYTSTQFKERIAKLLKAMEMEDNEFQSVERDVPRANSLNQVVKIRRKNRRTEPNVQYEPEYFKIDQTICHKLFVGYQGLGVGAASKPGLFSFEERELHNASMNYLKILQIFKDAKIKLEINQKLLISRCVKKFSFNQNFLNEAQFSKVFKVIVHGLRFDEQLFSQLAQKKYEEVQRIQRSIQKQKLRHKERFKTQQNTISLKSNNQRVFSRVSIDEGKKLRILRKEERGGSRVKERYGKQQIKQRKSERGRKPIKITWDNLFNLREDAGHENIIVPELIKRQFRKDQI